MSASSPLDAGLPYGQWAPSFVLALASKGRCTLESPNGSDVKLKTAPFYRSVIIPVISEWAARDPGLSLFGLAELLQSGLPGSEISECFDIFGNEEPNIYPPRNEPLHNSTNIAPLRYLQMGKI